MDDTPGQRIVTLTPAVHRWNLIASSLDTGIYTAAATVMGPMVLISFLFSRIGIDPFWIGFFAIALFLPALGGPLANAVAGNHARKMPFCRWMGFIHRLPFLMAPVGVMYFYDSPRLLLVLLIVMNTLGAITGGAILPAYQAVIANSTYERRWGTVYSSRMLAGSFFCLLSTFLVWQINQRFPVPQSYVILTWAGLGLFALSFIFAAVLREAPEQTVLREPSPGLLKTLRRSFALVSGDRTLRWLVAAQTLRASGFLMGIYMAACLIQRRGLTEGQMWVPVVLLTGPELIGHFLSGRIIDRFGPKAALTLSAALVCVNSLALAYAQSWPAFIVIFASGAFGGSLHNNAWPVLLSKLSPPSLRTLYIGAIPLACAPGGILASLIGMYIVYRTGFDYVFHFAALGGLLGGLIFWRKLPALRSA